MILFTYEEDKVFGWFRHSMSAQYFMFDFHAMYSI